jgi:hypothetical protein
MKPLLDCTLKTILYSIFLLCLLTNSVIFAQSKKDLLLQVDTLYLKNRELDQRCRSLEEKFRILESEVKNIQTNFLNISTTMSMITRSNTDLDAQVKSQSTMIQKLTSQNDSLLKVFNISGEAKILVDPKNETDSIIYLIQKYYSAKRWEDRLPLVLNSDKVKPLMAESYQNKFSSKTIEKQRINVPNTNYQRDKTFKVFVDGVITYLKRTSQGFKIDWEATYGYNTIDPSVICSEKSTIPTKIRVEVKLDDYYPPDYGITKSGYVALHISGCIGSCYISLSNSKAIELKKILSDGKYHELIIEGAFKTYYWSYDNSNSLDYFIITKFIKEGWDE